MRASPLRRYLGCSPCSRAFRWMRGHVCALKTLPENKNKLGTMAAPPHRNLWSLSDICVQHKDHASVHDSLTHAGPPDLMGSEFNAILFSCPQAQLQSEPAADNTQAKLCSRRTHAQTHTHRAAFENTQRNDSSSPTGGFTDSRDTLT